MAEIHIRREQYPRDNQAAERHYHAATQHGHEAAEHAQESLSNFTHYLQDKTPPAQRILAIITMLPLGGFLLLLSGISLTLTLIGMAVATPLFVIFSPVIVPAVIVMGLAVAGFVTSGAFGLTAVSSLSWIVNYVRRWRGGGVLEGLGEIVGETTKGVGHGIQEVGDYVGQKTKDVGQGIEDKSREVAHQQERGWDRDVGRRDVGWGGWDRDVSEIDAWDRDVSHTRTSGGGAHIYRPPRETTWGRTAGPGDVAEHAQQSIANFIHYIQERSPPVQQVLAITTIFPIGGLLLLLSGLTLTATLIGLALSTPPFIIFSPIILPAIFIVGLAVTGFIASGAFGITGLSSLSWIVSYVRRWRMEYYYRMRRGGGTMMEELGELVGETTKGVGQGIRDVGDYVGQKTKDVGQGIEDKSREVGQKTKDVGHGIEEKTGGKDVGQQRGKDADVGVHVRTKEVKARDVGRAA